MSSRCSTLVALAAAAVLLPALANAQQATIVAPNALPPGLGSKGIAAPAPTDGRADAGKTEGKPAFKELRLDNQSGALNSFVRVGPPVNGQGQGSAESRSSGSP